jgi:hypothetical protein
MHGAIPPFAQYTLMAWCSVKKHRDNFMSIPPYMARAMVAQYSDCYGLDNQGSISSRGWDVSFSPMHPYQL